MKKMWMWCLVVLFSMGSALSQDKPAAGGTEKAVAALEQQWLQSQKTNNPDLVAPLLADKFITTGSDGKVNNKAEVAGNSESDQIYQRRLRRHEGDSIWRYGNRHGRIQG